VRSGGWGGGGGGGFWGRPSDRYRDIMTLILEKQRVEVRNELPFITLRRVAQAVPLQACIQEVPGLNLYRSGHYYATHFRVFRTPTGQPQLLYNIFNKTKKNALE